MRFLSVECHQHNTSLPEDIVKWISAIVLICCVKEKTDVNAKPLGDLQDGKGYKHLSLGGPDYGAHGGKERKKAKSSHRVG